MSFPHGAVGQSEVYDCGISGHTCLLPVLTLGKNLLGAKNKGD